MKKKFILKLSSEEAFNKDGQEQKIAKTAKPYNTKTAQARMLAEELDRYDDFGALKIDLASYKQIEGKEGTGDYGIPYSHIHKLANTSDVILEHQQRAAILFLKDLRGFGLLADVVGSGKTFEACLVLSELAIRGKINSLLLVVPEQTYGEWIDVLENKFGLGKGVLEEVKEPVFTGGVTNVSYQDGMLKRPKRPAIVKTEDFVKWTEGGVKDLLFDAIVVDEAHHLCLEEGEYANALSLLSHMMETKKKVNSTYCILLSATPHSGNLEKMFRLWYFIRCKGGNPSDFEEKDDEDRTDEYRSEKEFYLNNVCRGAATVAEYVAVSKKYELEGVGKYVPEFKDAYIKYLKENLQKESDENFIIDNIEKYYFNLSEAAKRIHRDKFLSKEENKKIRAKVLSNIADSYHNGVMRSIMIRQPNRLAKAKKAKNYYFFPVVESSIGKYKGTYREFEYVVNPDNMYADDGVVFALRGNANMSKEKASLIDFSKKITNMGESSSAVFAEILISEILKTLNSFGNKKIFSKANSLQYYWEQMEGVNLDSAENIVIIAKGYKGDIFEYKYKELLKILKEKDKERIIIFFDYDIPKYGVEEKTWKRLYEKLINEKEISDRIIYAANPSDLSDFGMSDYSKSIYLDNFNKKENAIFLAGDEAFTEGVNLQQGSVLINFEVTPDPLAIDQRIGRIYRLGQLKDVEIISFAAMNELEGYALAYFNRIGLTYNLSGDATIIAGSNNENMVAVQCPACDKVDLYSDIEYAELKRTGRIRCTSTELCTMHDPRGVEKQIINVEEFKCDNCGAMLTRRENSSVYTCFATNNKKRGKLQNALGENNKKYHCSKYCIIQNCKRFERDLLDKCPILINYAGKEEPMFSDCKMLCYNCQYRGNLCPDSCNMFYDNMLDSIQSCLNCSYAICSPKPHVIEFDKDWKAPCPKRNSITNPCTGTLRPVTPKTFATYIKKAYNFEADGGESFCLNFLKEARKTDDLRRILEKDELREKN